MGLTLKTGKYGSYYGNDFNSSQSLTQKQLETNAIYICKYFTEAGWSLNAIAGILGNLQSESALNPGRWQGENVNNLSGGYGLAQWTPASKYIDWCREKGISPEAMDSNLARVAYEVSNGIQYYKTSTYPESFKEFIRSAKTPYYLACAFAWNYERSYVVLMSADQYYDYQGQRNLGAYYQENLRQGRGGRADTWYKYLLSQSCVAKAISEALKIAADPASGYSQLHRWGPDYDCSSFVATVWERAGVPVISKHGAGNTSNLESAFIAAGFEKAIGVDLKSGKGLRAGDVVLGNGHVEMVSKVANNGSCTLVGAHHGENGKDDWQGLQTGDQLNDNVGNEEIGEGPFYSYPWYIALRYAQDVISVVPTNTLPVIKKLTISKIEACQVLVTVNIDGEGITTANCILTPEAQHSSGTLARVEGMQSFIISWLVPNKKYKLKISATNGAGTTEQEITFTTLQDWPDTVRSLKISSINNKNLETSAFLTELIEPSRWGYWKETAKNSYGYRIYLVSNYRLLGYKDISIKDTPIKNFNFLPKNFISGKTIKHGENLQIGINTWVTDNEGNKIFADKSTSGIYPVCSNSICMKLLEEMSDILYINTNNSIHRVQTYFNGIPTNIFKI